MKIEEILTSTQHRPWNLPNEKWRFYQEWNHAIFLHYQVELSALEKFVPKDLEIDLFEGKPWVSIVAFTMEKMRPKNLPSWSVISNFDEINIRTYVKFKGKSGVYFLSIEGGKKLSCQLAKAISELPYRFSKTKRADGKYYAKNQILNDSLSIDFTIGNPLEQKEALDLWLTERYALFQDTENFINAFEIHHLEWEIDEIEIQKLELDYNRFNDLFSNKPEKTHYSKGVKVIAWGKHRTKKQF